ncbi:MAG: FecR domain-containing protein [Siphonobacter aquaeclarae]|nr:FecR domain-containing protein [Siphonobacter aquaeclarae]
MSTPLAVTQELLFRYFAGSATTFEKQQIDTWMREEANRESFYACLDVYEHRHHQFQADAGEALERHRERIRNNGVVPAPVFRRRFPWKLTSVAAAVALVATGFLFREKLLYRKYTTGFGETRRLTLSDGSRVILNANSELKEPRFALGDTARRVYLSGEADFSVVHTPDDRRLVVKTVDGMEVVVLGTEFTVYDRHHSSRVVLRQGKVELRYREGTSFRKVILRPGELVRVKPKQELVRVERTPAPEKYRAWSEDRFVFEETSLREIVGLFEDNYGVTLEIRDPELADWTISGSFTAHNGQELLELLVEASSLKFTQTGNHILITKPTK